MHVLYMNLIINYSLKDKILIILIIEVQLRGNLNNQKEINCFFSLNFNDRDNFNISTQISNSL